MTEVMGHIDICDVDAESVENNRIIAYFCGKRFHHFQNGYAYYELKFNESKTISIKGNKSVRLMRQVKTVNQLSCIAVICI